MDLPLTGNGMRPGTYFLNRKVLVGEVFSHGRQIIWRQNIVVNESAKLNTVNLFCSLGLGSVN